MKALKLEKLVTLLKPKLRNKHFYNFVKASLFYFGKIWDAFVFLVKWKTADAQLYPETFWPIKTITARN